MICMDWIHLTDFRIAEKYTLTISEACEYFNIGDKKLRKLIDENKSAEYIMTNGTKYLIKRRKFEEFIDNTSSI